MFTAEPMNGVRNEAIAEANRATRLLVLVLSVMKLMSAVLPLIESKKPS